MNINTCIYILLVIFSFQYYILARKYDQNNLENELFNLLERKLELSLTLSDESAEELTIDEYGVDPNDRVDVDLWNKLNNEESQNMPQIDDYSDETTAILWFKWFLRIFIRYRQVYNFYLILFSFIVI
jgi:hypothetical protein